jgi:hypothetical protein
MIAAIVLAGFAFITFYWAGLFYVPAAVAMLLAALAPDLSARPSHPAKGIVYTDTEIEEFKRKGLM